MQTPNLPQSGKAMLIFAVTQANHMEAAISRHALGALYSPENEYQRIFPISGATTLKLKGEL